jgi:hypothetical protein
MSYLLKLRRHNIVEVDVRHGAHQLRRRKTTIQQSYVHRAPALGDFVTSTADSQTSPCSEQSESVLKGLGHDKLKKVSK